MSNSELLRKLAVCGRQPSGGARCWGPLRKALPFSLRSEDAEESEGGVWGSGKGMEVELPYCALAPTVNLMSSVSEHKYLCVFKKDI